MSRQHRAVTDAGRFFKRHIPPRVSVDHQGKQLPKQISLPQPFATKNMNARIDDDIDEQNASEIEWEVHALHTGDEEDSIPWHITAPAEDLIDQVEQAVTEALRKAERSTHIGYIRVPKSAMPRIIGRQGAGLEYLRNTTGAEVEALGKRDADTCA
jgi:hypothetical protein